MSTPAPTSQPTPAGFAAGTLVHTQSGLVPIERIQVGDFVLSKHESGEGEREYKRVTRTFAHENRPVITISHGGRQTGGAVLFRYLLTTPEQPFWVLGKSWVVAEKLKLTYPKLHLFELLKDENSQYTSRSKLFKTETPDIAWWPGDDKVSSLREKGWRFHIPSAQRLDQGYDFIDNERLRNGGRVKPEDLDTATVYNIEVEDFPTYYVGEAGVWVAAANSAASQKHTEAAAAKAAKLKA
ncbi:MAG: HINT domain-containing protein, partial [Rhodocyclales bacterium]|nr:HINT domain-containing protein [Rhodocyclales bacterium]